VGFGVWTVFDRAGATHPGSFAAWLLGLVAVHDLIVAPAVSAAAAALGPRLPPRVRGAVFAAAIVSVSLVLVSLPPLLGATAGNDSLLPRNYAAGLAIALGSVWFVTILWVVARRRRTP
jgi:hypothetical protein